MRGFGVNFMGVIRKDNSERSDSGSEQFGGSEVVKMIKSMYSVWQNSDIFSWIAIGSLSCTKAADWTTEAYTLAHLTTVFVMLIKFLSCIVMHKNKQFLSC